MNASELMIQCLRLEGVEVIAGVSGRPILALLQAMNDAGMRHIQTRHEQGAGFLADGYARASGKPGVALVQRGPGVTNCITPIANAMIDGIPLIVLIGQGEMEMFDKGALQELDHPAFLRYFVKWFFRLHDAKRIPEIIRRAFRTAVSGKPGPVVIELPMNVMESIVDNRSAPSEYVPGSKRIRVAGDPNLVEQAARVLVKARAPVIYAGGGVIRSGASAALLEFAELLGCPVMTSLPGKSCFPENHPLSLGLGGLPHATYGTKQAVEFTKSADVVLALGCSFREHGTGYFKPISDNTSLIQVDISEAELGKNYPADVGILGDIRLVLEQLCAALHGILDGQVKEQIKTRWAAAERLIAELKSEWLSEWTDALNSDAVPINPYRITTELAGILDMDTSIVLQDAGLVRAYICHHLETRFPGSFMGYGGFSAMGYSIPACIGAKLARPEKTVINIIGDGSFGMTGLEVETAVRYGLQVIILVYNNRGMDAVRRLQVRRNEPFVWDEVGGNYSGIAAGMGAFSVRVEKPENLAPAIRSALSQEKPAVIEIMVEKLVPTPAYR